MVKLLVSIFLLVGSSAFANNFCASQAIEAAKGLANVNGSVSGINSATSKDGKIFSVTLQDVEGKDLYIVQTDGGHDCTIRSVLLNVGPTRYP